MIRSSSIEGHHFLRSHRRGYDPAEVDAVIKRLVDTLRKYEQRDAARDDSDIATTITDLEATRLARCTEEEIEHLRHKAVEELSAARLTAEQTLAAAEEEADHLVEGARTDTARLVARRNERSEALISAALSEVKALRSRTLQEMNDYRAAKRAEAASIIRTAELTSDEIIENARHEAGSILGRARREHSELERKLAQLRSAIAGIEGQFRHLAQSTLEQTEIMAAMVSLETDPVEEVVEEKSPEVVRLTQPGMTIDLTHSVEEPTQEHHQDRFAVAPGQTIYERRGGGLRKRLEDLDITETPPAD